MEKKYILRGKNLLSRNKIFPPRADVYWHRGKNTFERVVFLWSVSIPFKQSTSSFLSPCQWYYWILVKMLNFPSISLIWTYILVIWENWNQVWTSLDILHNVATLFFKKSKDIRIADFKKKKKQCRKNPRIWKPRVRKCSNQKHALYHLPPCETKISQHIHANWAEPSHEEATDFQWFTMSSLWSDCVDVWNLC